MNDTTSCQLYTSKLHFNSTLTPLLNSCHQLGEIWWHKRDQNSTFLIPVMIKSGWKLGVQIYTSKNSTLTPILNSTYQLGEIWVHKLDLNWIWSFSINTVIPSYTLKLKSGNNVYTLQSLQDCCISNFQPPRMLFLFSNNSTLAE